jgi:hypothetical protein
MLLWYFENVVSIYTTSWLYVKLITFNSVGELYPISLKTDLKNKN